MQLLEPRALAVLFVMMPTACETTRTTETITDTSCEVFDTITFSASGDTPDTIRQIRGHNAAYRAVCS